MKIAILSREPKSYSTKRLKEACKARGHRVKILDTLKFAIHVSEKKPELYYNNRPLEKFDAVIPRIGASITGFGTSVVRHFEQMGIFCLNGSTAISDSRDKLRATQILSRHDIGIAPTVLVRQKDAILPGIEFLGGAPVILKLIEGTQGVGVILAETNKTAEAIVQTLHSAKLSVLIQKFVKESKGKDIRAFVVGGKVVGAMRRQALEGEFRSNVHLGGSVEVVKLTPEYEKTAIQASQILGLRVAGVDMLEGHDGPVIMEVNSSPGLQGIETATEIDIANEIIHYVEAQADFPSIDIRQRLTLDHGYGVAEIPIKKRSELKNKTIQESGLKEKSVVVLTIIRNGKSIPNPSSSEKIKQGDNLLCYGPFDSIKTYLKKKATPVRMRAV